MSEPGPEILEERTLWGIFVHLLGPILGLFLALPLYAITDHEFTRENARHVINWHLMVIGVVLCLLAWIVLVELLGIPDALAIVLFLPLFVGFMYITIGTFVFAVVGTVKAVFGTPWAYPFTPEFLGTYIE